MKATSVTFHVSSLKWCMRLDKSKVASTQYSCGTNDAAHFRRRWRRPRCREAECSEEVADDVEYEIVEEDDKEDDVPPG